MIAWNGSRRKEEPHRPRLVARLWIARMRRACYFSPLALALATMLLATSFAPLAAPGFAPRAEAQTEDPNPPDIDVESCAPNANRIIQEICDENSALIPIVPTFEAKTIDEFLVAHQLPPEDRERVLKYARSDVRSGMLTKILAIIKTAEDERTDEQQAVYDWFQALVWQNEKDMVQATIDEYGRWFADPCLYSLDPVIADAYDLTYSGAPFCHPDPFSLGPEAPDKEYFLAVGLRDTYGAGVTSDPRGGAVLAATVKGVMFYMALPTAGLLAAAAAAFGTGLLVSSGIAAAVFPFASAAGSLAAVAAAAVAAVVVVVVLAIVIGVLAGIKVFSPTALDELQALRTSTGAAAPDLNTFTTGTGLLKLTQTLVAQTLPEHDSLEAPPDRQPGDAVFVIQPNGGTPHASEILTYRDWNDVVKTVTLVGGWFVVSQTLTDGTVKREMTLGIDHKDWNGRKWTAWRTGDTFVHTKGEVDTVFTAPDSEVPTIDLLDGTTAKVHVSIGRPPAITSASATAFSIGASNSFTVTTTGSTPSITVAGALPTGVTFVDKHDGTATLSGTPADGTAGTYPMTIMATSAAGSASQSFTLNAGTAPVLSSVPSLIFRQGTAASATIRASGAPPPVIRLDHLLNCDLPTGVCTHGGGPNLPAGLTFTDKGDGTATITGTPTVNTVSGTGIILTVLHFLSATNGNGKVVQQVSVGVKPPLTFTSQNSTVFGLGVSNSFTISVSDAVGLSADGALPAGVTFTDKGNGTATLVGIPSVGTRGSYPLTITASDGATSVVQSFTLQVEPKLTALGPARAWIGVGNSDNVGLRVDVRAEVLLKVGATVTPVGEGQINNQPTGSSGFNNAVHAMIPVNLVGAAPALPAGSELQYRLSVRRTCSGPGHNSGTAVVWYNGRAVDSGTTRDAGSRIGATIGGVAADLFLRPSLGLSTAAGAAKTSLSAPVNSAQPCPGRTFTPFGTWKTTLP